MSEQPYRIELPARAPARPGEQLWRVEFWPSPTSQYWVDNVSEAYAQDFYRLWREGSPYRATFCKLCPSGPVDCPHDELPEQRGWPFTELTKVRIMPMREAL